MLIKIKKNLLESILNEKFKPYDPKDEQKKITMYRKIKPLIKERYSGLGTLKFENDEMGKWGKELGETLIIHRDFKGDTRDLYIGYYDEYFMFYDDHKNYKCRDIKELFRRIDYSYAKDFIELAINRKFKATDAILDSKMCLDSKIYGLVDTVNYYKRSGYPEDKIEFANYLRGKPKFLKILLEKYKDKIQKFLDKNS